MDLHQLDAYIDSMIKHHDMVEKEEHKPAIRVECDTAVEESAVMVESMDACIAIFAMFGSRWFPNLACWTHLGMVEDIIIRIQVQILSYTPGIHTPERCPKNNRDDAVGGNNRLWVPYTRVSEL